MSSTDSTDKPGQLGGNYKDYKEYLEALQEKPTAAPVESAAKRELRKLVEQKVAVKNRIEAFSTKKMDSIKGDAVRVKRTVSCKIGERVNAIESVEKQDTSKPVSIAKSAVAPRAMLFDSVSSYKQGMNKTKMMRLQEDATVFNPAEECKGEETEKNEECEKMTEEEFDSAVRVCFSEDVDADRKSSIGKYALTPMPSVEQDNEEEEEEPQRDEDEYQDEGVVMRTRNASLDGLTADELNSEYQKIEIEIQRISQEIDKEVQVPECSYVDTVEITAASKSLGENKEKGADGTEVADTLREFDEKVNMLEK